MRNPILTLARRDVRDSLSDWRTFIPLTILSFFVPVFLRYGLRVATTFWDDDALTRSLVPIGLIIAGFLPAALSLVGPLEAFVGERERNTLEALLAAPISNRGLYLGKFFAAMLPPIVASLLAITIFSLMTWGTRNAVFAQALTPFWVGVGVVIVLIKTVLMVSSALYISLHSSSIRAANLLASFILLPITLIIQAEALLFIDQQWLIVVLMNLFLLALTVIFIVQGIRSFDREAILAREHQAINTKGRTARLTPNSRKHGPIATIFRRELGDTITDWRMIIPMSLLMVLVPIMAVGGTIAAYHNMAEKDFLQRLMSFLFLLVGFLPASFSLVIALEVFVGEKERGTLESLFSMPITDRQLYIGKSIAALIPPMFAGLVAMFIYYVGLWLFGPAELLVPLKPDVVVGMVALGMIQACAMVAGAVVISSHTSTVRLANLLASFVLLPITALVQIEAVLLIGERYDVLVWIGFAMALIAVLLSHAGLQSFHRESILSREHLALHWSAIGRAILAFWREIRPAGSDPDKLAPSFSLRRFYREELPVIWRELRWPLVGVGLFVIAAVIVGTQFNPQTEREIGFMRFLVPTRNIGEITAEPSLMRGVQIFLINSQRVLFTGLLSAISFGFIAMLVPMIAFFSVSYGATWSATNGITGGAMGFLLAYALPHGIIELPAAILMAAAGLRVGASLAFVPPTYTVGRHLLWSIMMLLKFWLLVIVPMLCISGLIEGIITPLVMRQIYG